MYKAGAIILIIFVWVHSNFGLAPSASTQEYNALYTRKVDQTLNAPLVAFNPKTDRLHYGPYSNQGENSPYNIIPDFSFAGYMGGGVALPKAVSIPTRISLSPDGERDDYQRIQDAIDSVSAMPLDERGIRGAVLLKAGAWHISAALNISASGVILRGEGQGQSGTLLTSTSTKNRDTLLFIRGEGNGRNPAAADRPAQTKIIQGFVPVGSNSVAVESTEGYAIGARIGIRKTPNKAWIGPSGVNMTAFGWTAKRYDVVHERTILDISDNVLIFDIPIVDTIYAEFGGGHVYRIDTSARLQQVGIENLRMDTQRYGNKTRMDRAFYAMRFKNVENAWVRNVTLRSFSHGFSFEDGTRAITAQDLAHLDPDFIVKGGNHYAFIIQNGTQILFQRCYASRSRHALITGSTVPGPNVFLDCLAERSDSDAGPHHRWATGTLYDNTKDKLWRMQNRADAGSGHGWSGAQQLLWNSHHDEIVLQAPPYAMNYAVSNKGKIIKGSRRPNEPNGIIQNHRKAPAMRSLYLQQLEDRLGPDAVSAVTLPAQRRGRIWKALSRWKGEGVFSAP